MSDSESSERPALLPIAIGSGAGAVVGGIAGGLLGGMFGWDLLPMIGAGGGAALGMVIANKRANRSGRRWLE